MLAWIARRELGKARSAFLLGSDFESIWDIAFRWCGLDPNVAGTDSVPEQVAQHVDRLIRGFFKGDLVIRRRNGYKVPHQAAVILFWDINPWRNLLWDWLAERKFDPIWLRNLYVERSDVLAWCEKQQLNPPGLWAKASAKESEAKKPQLENRSRDEGFDRLVCQAIARVYWDIDPNIHPAHMASAKAIKIYGNGKVYKDDGTIKGWIGEVDPRKGERKSGRPENISYRIDLETGRLTG